MRYVCAETTDIGRRNPFLGGMLRGQAGNERSTWSRSIGVTHYAVSEIGRR